MQQRTSPAAGSAQSRPRGLRLGLFGKGHLQHVAGRAGALAVFAWVDLGQQSERIRGEADRAMQSSAERLSVELDEWLDKNLRALQTATAMPAIASMNPDAQQGVLTAIQQGYPWIYLAHTIGLDGKNVARSDGKPPASYADRQYFKDVAASGRDLAWENLIGKTSGKPALVLAVPIKSNGALVSSRTTTAVPLAAVSARRITSGEQLERATNTS